MMDERMEEQASLYVLGALNEAETAAFQQAMQQDPELRALVARLSAAPEALVGALPQAQLPPHLRDKVLARAEASPKIVPMAKPKSTSPVWLPWALAACVAILCAIAFNQDSQLRKTVRDQAAQMEQLNRLAQDLQSATNGLQQTVRALQETNRLANLRIAMLNSLVANAPKTIAVSLWDEGRQEGVFVGENLKPLPADKDYQLWVLDNGKIPIDAGVFHVDENGRVRVEYKTKFPIKVAGRFAVTEEVSGGVASPTIKNMVLASN
jgi:anti-sigma-K factor RskA